MNSVKQRKSYWMRRASHTERDYGFPLEQIDTKSGEYVLDSIQVAVMALNTN